jgi:hypothetical protein
MAKSKNRKNHKEKSAARKTRLNTEKNKSQKMQQEFIKNLIKQEQEKGLFNNNPLINPIETPIIEGPSI